MSLLEIKNLALQFSGDHGTVHALNHVSLKVKAGQIVGLVGESGSGKSVTCYSILKLLPPRAKVLQGDILFQKENIMKMRPEQIRKIRGKQIAMIFQEPMSALNPVFRISRQLGECYQTHTRMKQEEIHHASIEILKKVQIPDPERILRAYPHELSGGLSQRVMIAMALALKPKLLIADEPTTALDVTVQAEILNLIRSLQEEMNMAVLIVSHDLEIIAGISHRIAVMYAGEIVEEADAKEIYECPKHPYTQGLLKCLPGRGKLGEKLYTIQGQVPDMRQKITGCAFAPRCPYAEERCRESPISLEKIENETRSVRCLKWQELK